MKATIKLKLGAIAVASITAVAILGWNSHTTIAKVEHELYNSEFLAEVDDSVNDMRINRLQAVLSMFEVLEQHDGVTSLTEMEDEIVKMETASVKMKEFMVKLEQQNNKNMEKTGEHLFDPKIITETLKHVEELAQIVGVDVVAALRKNASPEEIKTILQPVQEHRQTLAKEFREIDETLAKELADDNKILHEDITKADKLGLIVAGIALVFLTIFVTTTALSITRPLRRISSEVEVMSEGNYGNDISGADRGDEIGDMARSLNHNVKKIREIVGNIQVSSSSVAASAEEISSASMDLSKRTESQASTLEQTAASMEQITGTVRSNAKNSQEANTFATEARAVAQEGGEVVKKVVGAMEKITTSSTKIADIISVIDEIAFQTNLLALNAAVEAARAGDAGKGFAVVADEVRALAGRSSQASKEIKELINQSVNQVKDGSVLVEKAGTTLDKVVDSFNKLAALISEITVAGEEQSQGINEINSAVSQMDAATQENAAMVEESTASAQTLSELAQNLNELLTFFKFEATEQSSAPVAEVKPAPKKVKTTPKPVAKIANNNQADFKPKKVASAAPVKSASEGWEEF
jgi:methyl-accepting chemotaxis protein